MSKPLEPRLPEEISDRLTDLRDDSSQLVVPLISVDRRGLPHPALISMFELISHGKDLFCYISERSKTCKNLSDRRVMALLFVEPSGCFYLKGHARRVETWRGQALFRVDLIEVLQDFPSPDEGEAFLVSATRFQGDSESVEQRSELREEMIQLLERRA